MIDKDFCCSSYCAFRYIEKDGMDFYEGLHHENIKPVPENERKKVHNAEEIDAEIKKTFESLKGKNLGILLSGGMDSACLASYLPEGSKAYTFRFLGGDFQKEELARAEKYAETYKLDLHYVDINWDTVEKYLKIVVDAKNAPVHSIEPQLYQAAKQAMADGVDHLIVGESADLVFGGMDQLLSQDWTLEDFKKRYTFLEPELVLENPVDMSYVYERYRTDGDKIDFLKFMDEIFSIESSSSYLNAFNIAGITYTDPYAKLEMADPLDLARIRSGDTKYLVRDLFRMKYPEIPVPNKNPMPRPVDSYFEKWEGPKRKEFKKDIDMSKLTGNQKWQLYCLEKFLEWYDK